jgi:lauroyl/myristoyl acyltransferase
MESQADEYSFELASAAPCIGRGIGSYRTSSMKELLPRQQPNAEEMSSRVAFGKVLLMKEENYRRR